MLSLHPKRRSVKQILNRKQNQDQERFPVAGHMNDESGFLSSTTEISMFCCNMLRWTGVSYQFGEH